jgi:hypothetical protein
MMKRIALLMALLVTALPALAHEKQERRIYELERMIEKLEHRIEGLERNRQLSHSSPNEDSQLSAEYQELFHCQANASNSTEMKACAKYITD